MSFCIDKWPVFTAFRISLWPVFTAFRISLWPVFTVFGDNGTASGGSQFTLWKQMSADRNRHPKKHVYVLMLLALKLDLAIIMSSCQRQMQWWDDKAVRPLKVLSVEVFYLPQLRTPSTRQPLALCHMWLTSLLIFCWWMSFENFPSSRRMT